MEIEIEKKKEKKLSQTVNSRRQLRVV